ncbi:MAG: nucleotide exchange factor GrpE [Elusimicrobia bacterium]|nr:nucleotide exchange factor GrpE [Elusimicrobiota bacterium]
MSHKTPHGGGTAKRIVPPAEPEFAAQPPQPGADAAGGAPAGAPPPAQGGVEAPAPGAQAPAPAQDYYDQLLRLKAEFENYRKRVDREKPDYIQLGHAEVLIKLLPIYDLLLKAHQEVQASHTDTPLAKGMEGIFKEFDKIFKEEGVQAMAPEGKPYDAMLHEVLCAVEKAGCPEGTVVDVIQAGFTLHGKALRPAKVRIAKPQASSHKPPPAGEACSEGGG